MKRSWIKRIGKIGKVNIEARKRIAEISEEKNLVWCELAFGGCFVSFALAPAHRHKRAWYKGDVELLSDYKQWVCACQFCHDKIEFDVDLTEEMFLKLRGQE